MRLLTILLLAIFSSASYAACSYVASFNDDNVWIDIGDGCEDKQDMISFQRKQGDKWSPLRKIPFLSECSKIKDGFKCRADGKTPLAGATYRRINFGRSQNNCEENINALGEKYICVKGCGRNEVPEFLLGYDGSC